MNVINRDWAAKELEIAPQSDVGRARAALLKHLEAEGMLPAESRIAAWNHWAVDALPLSRDGRQELPAQSQADFDEFLAEYWELRPIDRKSRWHELSKRYPNGRIATQLKRLQKGLEFASKTNHGDARVRDMAALMREIFLLNHRSASVRRHEWLASIKGRHDLIEIAKVLNVVEPGLIGLVAKPERKVVEERSKNDDGDAIWGASAVIGLIVVLVGGVYGAYFKAENKPATSPTKLSPTKLSEPLHREKDVRQAVDELDKLNRRIKDELNISNRPAAPTRR
jgi:hypothetical protein